MNKYIKITTHLPQGIEEPVIGTEVKKDTETVGKVIAYDKETGLSTIKLKSTVWKEIAGSDIGLLKRINNAERKNS